jgi:hypothetical protein
MKSILLIILISISISFIGLGQRYCPKMENQVTKEDSLSDEFGREYFERDFQVVEVVEEDTTIDQQTIELDSLKNENIIDPDREIINFDLEKIIYIDIKKLEAEETKVAKEEDEENIIVNPKK